MIITFEGNVGAGKTSILNLLEKESFSVPHVVIFEPIEEWMNFNLDGGKSLFQMFYEDQKKYAFVFQMMALQTRYANMVKAIADNPNTIVLCERSFLTDYEIFAKLNNEEGNISDMELHVYKKWHSFFIDVLNPQIKGIVYLNTPPNICRERITKRNRKGEEDISSAYLDQLHVKHEEWLKNQTLTPCIHIDGLDESETFIKSIKIFIESVI